MLDDVILGQLRYPWLPADDEANVDPKGYYVPTPEEIAAKTAEIRMQTQADPRHDSDEYRRHRYCPVRKRPF